MLSKIVIGTMKWGQWGANYSANEMAGLIEKSCELGLTSFDHAAIYGSYSTEEDFGNAFKLTGISREKVQFVTKCGIQHPCNSKPYKVKHYDYSSSEVSLSVENSLRNLKTDYIDLFLLHRPSPLMSVNEIADVIIPLMENGTIRSFGVSNFGASKITLLSKQLPIKYNQIEASITKPDHLFDDLLDYMETESIIPMAWKPLGTVFQDGMMQKEEVSDVLQQLTLKYSCNADALLLAWLMKHSSGIIPVIGTTSAARIESQAGALNLNISTEDWFLLLKTIRRADVP
jgi:predicted oxidoreductase